MPGQPSGFAWRPGSDTITFVLHNWGGPTTCSSYRARLWHLDVATGEAAPYWPQEAWGIDAFPTWSADGKWLYFLRLELRQEESSGPAYWRPYRTDARGADVQALGEENLRLNGTFMEAPFPKGVLILPEDSEVVFTALDPDVTQLQYKLFCYNYQTSTLRDYDLSELIPDEEALKEGGSAVEALSWFWVPDVPSSHSIAPSATSGVGRRGLLVSDGCRAYAVDLQFLGLSTGKRLFQSSAGAHYPQQRPQSRNVTYLEKSGEVGDMGTLKIRDLVTGQERLVIANSAETTIGWTQPFLTYFWDRPYAWSADGTKLVFCIHSEIYVLEVSY